MFHLRAGQSVAAPRSGSLTRAWRGASPPSQGGGGRAPRSPPSSRRPCTSPASQTPNGTWLQVLSGGFLSSLWEEESLLLLHRHDVPDGGGFGHLTLELRHLLGQLRLEGLREAGEQSGAQLLLPLLFVLHLQGATGSAVSD